MTKEFLYEFIKQNKFAVVSTISVNRMPQSACVGIAVTPDLKLLFDTTTDSRKYENLKHTSRVSFVIGWEKAITVQYEGMAIHVPKDSIKEMFNTDFLLGATIVKLPSKSVIVPILVPFTVTLAPGTPSLSVSSVTLPLIVIPSGGKAYINGMNKRNVTRKQNLKLSAFLILFNLIG